MKIIIDYSVIWIIAGLMGACVFLWFKLDDYRKYNLFLLNKFKPYKKIERVLSTTENKLFEILKAIIDTKKYEIFPQLPYSSLIEVSPKAFDLDLRFETINNYRSDFVIVAKATSTPVLVIELNDSTHRYNFRKARDLFVYTALKTAEIPYLVFSTKSLTNPKQIELEIKSKIS